MNPIEKEKEKISKAYETIATGMLFLAYIITFIVIIIWLFKLLLNAKSEPSDRGRYISKDPLNYYTDEDFCYEYYEKFMRNGVIDTFDFPIKNIKKYTRALLGTIFISISSLIIATIIVVISKISFKYKGCIVWAPWFYLFLLLGIILSLVFGIILAHYYSKGNYSDFEEFSRCLYLSKRFKIDYNFIFRMKEGYTTPFFLVLITEFFNFIKLIGEASSKDYDISFSSKY